MWQHYTNAFLGLCVFVAAFLGLTGTTLVWTLGILGCAVVCVGLWGAASASPLEDEMRHA
jgi:hypothetical protein